MATDKLKGYQLNYLRALAHPLKPVILIGQKGVTEMVVLFLEEALDHHELIKVKFIENKAKARQTEDGGVHPEGYVRSLCRHGWAYRDPLSIRIRRRRKEKSSCQNETMPIRSTPDSDSLLKVF